MAVSKESSARRTGLSFPDVFAFMMLMAFFSGFVFIAKHWTAPLQGVEPPDLSFRSLPQATMLSLSRILLAYVICLFSSLAVGYWAAHSKVAETILIPLIDIGQSIPVLGFLPGLVLSFVALFPESRVGLEMAAILTLYTGMAWNLMLSFYSSIKTIPREYLDIVRSYGYGPLGALIRLEIPWAMNGIVWNSMLSIAGGWFFLSVCESFQLGDKSFRLVGLGSYMALAAERGDTLAIFAGVGVMVAILVLMDFFVWGPLLRWAERFQASANIEDEEDAGYNVISFFAKSKRIVSFMRRLRKRYAVYFFTQPRSRRKRRVRTSATVIIPSVKLNWDYILIGLLGLATIGGSIASAQMLAKIPAMEWLLIAKNTWWSFLRVSCTLVLSAGTMIPLGLWLGSQPTLVRRLQPVIQVIAAFPAPMVFPVLIGFFIWASIPLSVGSVALMMSGAQWYLLFNVIAGASTVPQSLVDVAQISGMSRVRILWQVYLPASFPHILTGLITAAGGAWNTSIVAELVVFRGQNYEAPGLGSYIAKATANAQYGELVAAVIVMVAVIVLLNRFFWARLYNLADDKYRLS